MADLRGGPNSFNFMQFLGKFGKIVCWRPPGELAPPPRGNPGSATDPERKSKKISGSVKLHIGDSWDKSRINVLSVATHKC